MSNQRPRFSIVIPCYNEANFIAEALTSLAAQDIGEPYEVVVVDNNCSDDTAKIAMSHGARVVVEKTPGVCFARQTGTAAAKGEIVISTDADTVFAPNWLSTIDKHFKQDKQLVALGGPCRYYSGPWWRVYTYPLFTLVYLYSAMFRHPFYISAANLSFKKSAWPGYDTSLTQGGDELDILSRLRANGRVKFINANPTYTSGRRLSHGFLYNVVVTLFFYYIGAYYVNKLFNRTVIGAYPAFRKKDVVRETPAVSYVTED